MGVVLASIPYETYPDIEIGPLTLRTFGLFVAIGVLVGAWFAARYNEELGIPRDKTYGLATRMVIGGVIGSRITYVLTHTDEMESPLDLIAVWKGGLQFSGGFLFAVIVGYPLYRKWARAVRWRSLDGYAFGLTIGLSIGRIACYAVGEHFGGLTSFFLATRYEGGEVREDLLGDQPLQVGDVFHNTALYEWLYLLVLFAVLTWLLYVRRHRPPTGTAIGIFCAYYGVTRWASDALRVNDERVLGMTGAQWMCLALLPVSVWILVRVRKLVAADEAAGDLSMGGGAAAPDEVTTPDAP